jgi:hypothetical protein
MSGVPFPVGRCTLLANHHGISQPSTTSWRLASSSWYLLGHVSHRARWSAPLMSKGSKGACTPSGIATFPFAALHGTASSWNQPSRFCLSTQGGVVPYKTEKKMLAEPFFSISQKPPRYCWSFYFHTPRLLLLHWILEIFEPAMTADARRHFQHLGVGQQYPFVAHCNCIEFLYSARLGYRPHLPLST